MLQTIVKREIDTNQYMQFICDKYLIEVIPDVSKHEVCKFRVHVRSIDLVPLNKQPDLAMFVDSGYIELDFEHIGNDLINEPPVIAKSKCNPYNIHFIISFSASECCNGRVTKGILTVEIVKNNYKIL